MKDETNKYKLAFYSLMLFLIGLIYILLTNK